MKVADPYLMREINKFHVLETIRRAGKTSRVEISELTQLSRTTVSAITGALIEEGLIQTVHVKLGTNGQRVNGQKGNGQRVNGEAQRGRPRVMLQLIASAAYVIGIRLSKDLVSIALTDFTGEPLSAVALPIRIARQTDDVVVDIIEDGVRRCVGDAGLALRDICGVGIGVPGIVDIATHRSLASSLFGVCDITIGRQLEERLKVPVQLDKSAHLLALAERWFGHGRDEEIFAVVTLDQMIGLGIFSNGDIYRGASALGPVFGHMKVGLGDKPCMCGQTGCLNTHASIEALMDGAKEVLPADEVAGFATSQGLVDHIVALARAGDNRVAGLFEMYGRALGMALSHLINMVNPGKVIVAGRGVAFADLFEAGMRFEAEKNSFSAHFAATEIVLHNLDDQLWARGAAALVLREIYQAPWTVVEK